jgi:hypothetical protein
MEKALQLALEALEEISMGGDPRRADLAITAIKAALEAKDEPWEQFCDSHCVWTDHHPDCKLAQQEAKDKPMHPEIKKLYEDYFDKCFRESSPLQRTWVGLTQAEIDYQAKKDDHGVYFAFGALWAEAKLKEKNT